MEFYELVRHVDVSGVSGTGVVGEISVFTDGTAVLHWVGDKFTTTTVHTGGLESILSIHGHGGKTELRKVNGQSRRRSANAGSARRHESTRVSSG